MKPQLPHLSYVPLSTGADRPHLLVHKLVFASNPVTPYIFCSYFLLNICFTWICACEYMHVYIYIYVHLFQSSPPCWSRLPLPHFISPPPLSTLAPLFLISSLSLFRHFKCPRLHYAETLPLWFLRPSTKFWTYLPFLWNKGLFCFLGSNGEINIFVPAIIIVPTAWCYRKETWHLAPN